MRIPCCPGGRCSPCTHDGIHARTPPNWAYSLPALAATTICLGLSQGKKAGGEGEGEAEEEAPKPKAKKVQLQRSNSGGRWQLGLCERAQRVLQRLPPAPARPVNPPATLPLPSPPPAGWRQEEGRRSRGGRGGGRGAQGECEGPGRTDTAAVQGCVCWWCWGSAADHGSAAGCQRVATAAPGEVCCHRCLCSKRLPSLPHAMPILACIFLPRWPCRQRRRRSSQPRRRARRRLLRKRRRQRRRQGRRRSCRLQVGHAKQHCPAMPVSATSPAAPAVGLLPWCDWAALSSAPRRRGRRGAGGGGGGAGSDKEGEEERRQEVRWQEERRQEVRQLRWHALASRAGCCQPPMRQGSRGAPPARG